MKHSLDIIDDLLKVHNLIRQGRHGTAQELANHLGISRSAFYRIMGLLESRGADIVNLKHGRGYRYRNDFQMIIGPRG